jgi:hypothetical protein
MQLKRQLISLSSTSPIAVSPLMKMVIFWLWLISVALSSYSPPIVNVKTLTLSFQCLLVFPFDRLPGANIPTTWC